MLFVTKLRWKTAQSRNKVLWMLFFLIYLIERSRTQLKKSSWSHSPFQNNHLFNPYLEELHGISYRSLFRLNILLAADEFLPDPVLRFLWLHLLYKNHFRLFSMWYFSGSLFSRYRPMYRNLLMYRCSSFPLNCLNQRGPSISSAGWTVPSPSIS